MSDTNRHSTDTFISLQNIMTREGWATSLTLCRAVAALLYVPLSLTSNIQTFYVLPTQGNCVFRMDL